MVWQHFPAMLDARDHPELQQANKRMDLTVPANHPKPKMVPTPVPLRHEINAWFLEPEMSGDLSRDRWLQWGHQTMTRPGQEQPAVVHLGQLQKGMKCIHPLYTDTR